MENNSVSSILILLIIFVGGFVAYKIYSQFKFPKINALTLISGGVKTGKTTFAVALAIDKYNRVHRAWKFKKAVARLLGKDFDLEEPLLYSNIPLSVPYVPVTRDLLMRNTRFNYQSVTLISEASLVADSQMIKELETNNRLLLFNKLYGHETRGGYLIYDTQSVSDCHYSIKRALSEYFYIHHLVRWIPGFIVAYVREDRYCEDGSALSVYDKDLEDSLTRVIIPKKVWKLFDSYCYSCITDDLSTESQSMIAESLKANNIISFRNWSKYFTKQKKVEKVEDEKKND